jgi:predicted Zn-dependent peptidase
MKRILIFFLVVFITTISFAQVDRSKRPEPGPAPTVNIGDAESFELPNGLKVFVVENHKLPKVTFNLIIDVDPVVEGKNVGYIDVAGSLLETGTKTRTKDQIDQEIDMLGASFSTSATDISASGLERNKEKIFEIMSDMIINSEFKQEELDKIIKQTLSGLAAAKDEPNTIAQRVGKSLMFGKDHPYGEIETEETVKSITLNMCKKYYESYFKPNVAYLAIVGDINLNTAKSLVEKYLGKWAKADVPSNKYETPKMPVTTKVSLVDRPSAVQSVIGIAYPIDLPIGSEDVIKASVANLILGGSSTGRLFMNLRERHGYTYGAYSSITPDKLVGSFAAYCSVRNVVTDSSMTEIISEMKKIRNEKVSEAELQKAKNYLSGSFIRGLENPGTVARYAINIARYNLPKDYYKNYLKNLNAVTIEDVQAMAKKYIKPNNANILIVGNAQEIVKNLAKFSISGKIDYYDIYGEMYDPNLKKVPEGVTSEQVINKFIDAIGGKEKYLSVKDVTRKLTANIQGMDLKVTIILKDPDKLYQFIDAGAAFQQKTIFDGVKGKSIAMGQDHDITGDMLETTKLQADLHAALDYAKAGIKTELTAVETINNSDAYKVILTLPSGIKITQYYDVKTGLMVRQVSPISTPQGTFNQTMDFDDYRDLNGLKFAYKLTQTAGPQTIELTTTSIELNTNPSDSLFEIK